ncbi:monovalent cation:proton antiporter-2 (CPA2) family protein [Prosthecobacter vanneervenii]|uniref:Monovalent cation:proton antiporter-2 (CPA2) family protein n=1 Tax=Prosthecobacter vanneervenii TaxID=48466 RepID=A0A7W7YFD4_9BACT|nr:monovalent cation:proton antiporter-2 (CPA2) family protein [Prosthecobacter vanneervenii]MBB5035094.1 monovalent cation:proton antiporter-2 (CPA2) family protein [Prosthecobacter vanneervenii]
MHAPHFFISAFIYLSAAVLLVPVAHRLGLGSVLGYLIGGALIGPFALGWVGGRQGEEAMHFAEFGVVIMLFMIGLELEPARLWRMRGPIFGLGGLQVSLTALAAMGVAIWCGLEAKPALATGMILALSSTAIVIQTLQEKALMRTDGGSDSFAVLLFQDISVIPMLAVFPLLAASGAKVEHHGWLQELPHWAQPIVTLGAVVAIVFAGQYVVPRGFTILAKTGLRELLTAAALLLIVGVALLMTQVGLSPALGAFVAGVVLAGSHYRHELESNLEPFKGLLLGLFFLAVGASLDFGVIAGKPLLVAGLVGALILLKVVVIYGIATLLKIRGSHRWLLSLALAQGGEFAFALLSMAIQQEILEAETARLLVAVVALSMAVTPLLFILYERVLAPRYTAVSREERAPDRIDEHAPVILAGFGRFGNFVGRFMMSQGVKVTVLESDPDHVDMLRKYGFKVFYGDATRLDLLHAAGIEHARLLIIALADQAKVAQLIAEVREKFPRLHIMARARDYDQRFELMSLGLEAEDSVHEQMHSGLELAVRALRALGKPAYATERAARRWRRYDEETVHLLLPVQEDDDAVASIVRERRIELTQLFEKDRAELPDASDTGWEINRAEES